MTGFLPGTSSRATIMLYLNIDCFNNYSIRPPPTSSVVIFTDAGDVPFGGFSSNLSVSSVSGMWLADDKGQFLRIESLSQYTTC